MNAEQAIAIAKVLIGIAILLGASRPLWMKRVDEKLNGGTAPVEHAEGPTARWVRRLWTNKFGRVVLSLIAGLILIFFATRIIEAIGTNSVPRAASASRKFASEEFGFAANFISGDVKEKKVAPVMIAFTSSNLPGTEYSEVRVLNKDLSQEAVDSAYLDRMMQMIVKNGGFGFLDTAKHTTVHGYPAITQNFRIDPASGHEGFLSMMIVVAKDRNHIYMVSGSVGPHANRSIIQRFLDSFELL